MLSIGGEGGGADGLVRWPEKVVGLSFWLTMSCELGIVDHDYITWSVL